ncbi:uncharacterized protein LOC126314447 [Schistocerca gregaria]|uniref:uncharacterized protein LOC126314447 n=1 Tax=Schistocerca gregaria TaxID=7010 RepID=UPI00211EA977|nr:uncharacterized protein LOC126314447 [Schistocerca gregaria]
MESEQKGELSNREAVADMLDYCRRETRNVVNSYAQRAESAVDQTSKVLGDAADEVHEKLSSDAEQSHDEKKESRENSAAPENPSNKAAGEQPSGEKLDGIFGNIAKVFGGGWGFIVDSLNGVARGIRRDIAQPSKEEKEELRDSLVQLTRKVGSDPDIKNDKIKPAALQSRVSTTQGMVDEEMDSSAAGIFLDPLEDQEDFDKWMSKFDLDSVVEKNLVTIATNEEISRLYEKLVPSELSEELFWGRYYYHIEKCSGDGQPTPAEGEKGGNEKEVEGEKGDNEKEAKGEKDDNEKEVKGEGDDNEKEAKGEEGDNEKEAKGEEGDNEKEAKGEEGDNEKEAKGEKDDNEKEAEQQRKEEDKEDKGCDDTDQNGDNGEKREEKPLAEEEKGKQE